MIKPNKNKTAYQERQDSMEPRNDQGLPIKGERRFLKDEWEAMIASKEIADIWELIDDNVADENGFDKNHIEPNGKHIMEVTLPRDTMLIRYGYESGSYTAPEGTEYQELSLPYAKETIEFHKYRVIADGIKVVCEVTRGRVAPAFEQPGGGIQYKHHKNIIRCLRAKEIERVL